jgi:hypothetical protein
MLGRLSPCLTTQGTITFQTLGGFAYQKYPYGLQRTIPSVRRVYALSSLHRSGAGCRILTACPSITPFGFTLGPD